MKHSIVFIVALALLPVRYVHADANADNAEQAVALMEQIATIVDTNKDNCDAMGDKLSEFLDKNADKLDKLKAAGKTLTDKQKKEFSEKYKDRMTAVGTKMQAGLKKCSSNAKVTAAMKKMT